MELAFTELTKTLEEANTYRRTTPLHPLHLKLHITALGEDIDGLATLSTLDDELRLQATQLIYEARRTRRNLEQELIDLQIQESNSISSSAASTSDNSAKAAYVQLPPLPLPRFDGDANQFRTYKTFFEENILQNRDLSDTNKWLRLKESLHGPPAELISELPQSGDTLAIAWKLLVEVYGGEDRPVVDLYNRIQQLQPATLQTDKLRLTHSKLEGLLMSLQGLGHDAEMNHFLRWTYLGKFPVDIVYQAQKTKDTPLTDLRLAIGQIIAARECADQQRPTEIRKNFTGQHSRSSTSTDRTATPTKKSNAFPKSLKCVFCEGEHWNDSCEKYPTLDTRKNKLTGRCFKCLRITHDNIPCVTEKRCFHCDSLDHNRALCPVKFGPKSNRAPQRPILSTQSSSSEGNFLTCLAHVRSNAAPQSRQIRLMLDTAGGSTLVTSHLAAALQIPATKETDEYTGINGVLLTTGHRLQEPIDLIAEDGTTIPIFAAVINGNIPQGPAPNVEEFRRSNPQYNDVYIPPSGENQPIDLLIGSDTIVDVLKPQQITAVNADTLLLPTKLGSLIVGRQRRQQRKVCHSHLFNFFTNPLKQISDLDLVGLTDIAQSEIDDEEAAIKQFYASVVFVDQRYSISWPWKTYPPQLDTNFGIALGRLRSLYKQLQKTPELLHQYNNIILQQLKDHIIETVDNSEPESPVIHYLPHHPVLRPEKSTSVRPVYDGSTKSSKQKSLNENIRKGTKWLNDLTATLIRFRMHKNVVVSDISRAFHQILLNKPDRDAARFIWLKDVAQPPTTNNLQIYRFTRVAFGVIASPFLLHAVIRYHAENYADKKFAGHIQQDLYADNLVSSLPEDINPIEFYEYAKAFFQSMSMNLTKWATNHPALHDFIPDSDRLDKLIQLILGIKWNIRTDQLSLKQPIVEELAIPTPRIVAKEMARWFDPLGWATPITLNAKIFFRKIWEEYKQWDAEIAPTYREEWSHTILKLQQIQHIQLPRQYSTLTNAKTKQLHAFVDASAAAYAIVVYMRTETNNQVQLSLIAAKSRLTPKKTVSIPRLELVAILLGCRFVHYIKETLQLVTEHQIYLWTDSKCALSWMQQNKILPPVLERYINEAKKYNIYKMNYVPSEMNYADVATRGTDFSTLSSLQWWSGPKWLEDVVNWPKTDEIPQTNIIPTLNFATQVTCKIKIQSETEIQGVATLHITDFSSLTSLLRRTAYCLKALTKLTKSNFLRLQSDIDTSTALRMWLSWDQRRHYALQSEPDAGRKFSMNNIAVFRDENGLLRCQTRIINSVANLNTINPILLVKKSTLTKLIILDIHTKYMHTGTSHTLASIRKMYWLPHGRRETYSVIHNYCFVCRKHLAQAYPNPPPAPLPQFRTTTSTKPFQAIGIDICGPFYTRTILGRNQPKMKKWILLFTCAVVRAVHLEVLNTMTTFEILLAFRRFFARRGTPQRIISDNAPQFHLLDGCFKNIWHDLNQTDDVAAYFAKEKIIWEFVPELSPWMGGMYERLVQSIKLAFEKTYKELVLLERQFETTVLEIEAILNARPISYVDKDIDSPLLSPNDFLMAQYSAIPMKYDLQTDDDTLKKLWRSSQTYLNSFWKNWSDHYLLLLRDRNDQLKPKRRSANKNPQKGDIVVMIDLSRKRSAWRTAVVERLIPSQDKQIRAVQIKLPNGSRLIRPITMLAPIHLAVDLPEVRDDQLTENRRALVLSLPESATHFNENTEDEEIAEQEDA